MPIFKKSSVEWMLTIPWQIYSFPCPGSQELIRTAAKAGEWKRNRNAVPKGQRTLDQAGYQDTSKSRAVPGAKQEGAVPPPQGVPELSLSPAQDGGRSYSAPFLGNMDRGAWWAMIHGVTRSWAE